MKKFFLSFASSNLSKSLLRIKQQAELMGVYDQIIVMNEHDLAEQFKTKHQQHLTLGSRGYGYWCWKPQIILQTLAQMEYGDILQYTDAGCHLNHKGKQRLLEYFDITEHALHGILAFQGDIQSDHKLDYDGRALLDLTEYKWIKGDLLDYFSVRDNSSITQTPTIGAGIIFIKKTQQSVLIIQQWLNAINHDFELVNDSPSKSNNLEGFVEHRHDQAIFSIICKLNQVTTLSAYEYWYPSIKSLLIPDWTALEHFPIHAKRDKDESFLLKITLKTYRQTRIMLSKIKQGLFQKWT